MCETLLSGIIYVVLLAGIVFWRRRVDIVHLLTLGLTVFFVVYAVLAMCLFCAGAFSIRRCLWAELLATAVFAAAVGVGKYAGRRKNPAESHGKTTGVVQKEKEGSKRSEQAKTPEEHKEAEEHKEPEEVGQPALLVHAASLQQNWPVYLLILFLAFATQGHFGFFGMGQDQGVYQVEAINLYYDQNDWRYTITDYDDVEDATYKAYCEELLQNTLGFNLTSGEKWLRQIGLLKDEDAGGQPGAAAGNITTESTAQDAASGDTAASTATAGSTVMDTKEDAVTSSAFDGIWHGIPAYAAMLGLSARIHGIAEMMRIGAAFYILSLLVFAMILEEQKADRVTSCLLTLLLGICPQLVWQEKSSLTEGFTALMILLYLYLLLHKEEEIRSLSVLPIAGFAVVHISIYVILPVLLLNYWVLYGKTGQVRYVRNAIEAALIYLVSFRMSAYLQPIYTIRKNYYNPLRRFLHMNQIIPFFTICALLAVVISLLLPWLRRRVRPAEKNRKQRGKLDPTAFYSLLPGMLYVAGVILTGVYAIYELTARHVPLTQVTIFCYLVLSGFVLVPLICARLCGRFFREIRGSKGRRQAENFIFSTNQILSCNMFLYTILLFSVFMRGRSAYYYYYTRYLAPYLGVILVTYVVLYPAGTLHAAENRRAAVLALGILALLPYTFVVCRNQDDTLMQWSTVTDLLDQVSQGDTVYLNPEDMLTMYHPLRAKGVKVYPVMDSLEKTMTLTRQDGKEMESSGQPEENGFKQGTQEAQTAREMQTTSKADTTSAYYLTNSDTELLGQADLMDHDFEIAYDTITKTQEDDLSADDHLTGLPLDISLRGSRRYVLYAIQKGHF